MRYPKSMSNVQDWNGVRYAFAMNSFISPHPVRFVADTFINEASAIIALFVLSECYVIL